MTTERIDLLNRRGYKIIQNTDGFCFGMDAVLLAHFAEVRKSEQAIDLGTGTGIIPILLEANTQGEHFTGLEIQTEVADMAKRSVLLNHLEDKVDIVEGDIKTAAALFGKAKFQVVTSNPPYMRESGGLVNPDQKKAISRHEILCTLEDVIRSASELLVSGGRFYMVHRPRRLAEICVIAREYGLHVRRVRMVHPFVDKPANMILVEAIRGGNAQLQIEAPCIIYKEQGLYTDEIRNYYEN